MMYCTSHFRRIHRIGLIARNFAIESKTCTWDSRTSHKPRETQVWSILHNQVKLYILKFYIYDFKFSWLSNLYSSSLLDYLIRGILEIAQKAIEGCHYHMMAYAFDFELAQNSNHSVFLIFSSKYQLRVKSCEGQFASNSISLRILC